MFGMIEIPELLGLPLILGSGLLGLIAIHFLPTIIALVRHHPKTVAIVLINVFLGWTLIGWVVALVWSLRSQPVTPAAQLPRSSA